MKPRLLLCSLAAAVALAGCLDRKTGNPDAATGKGDAAQIAASDSAMADTRLGSDTAGAGSDVIVPADGAPDAPMPATGGADGFDGGDGGKIGAGGTTGAGGLSAGGAVGNGGTIAAGGATSLGGATSAGGVVPSGGVSSGGVVATGGKVGSGGAPGTGGTSCVAKPRDCASSLDNDCNGTPDNQETSYCACAVSQTRPCQEHPGYDGVGVCTPGHQTCTASTDRMTSSWSACIGSIGPGIEVCDVTGLDESCDGQSNEGCKCVGSTATCECGGTTTCTNGQPGNCAVTKKTMYRDVDGDSYGDPNQSAQVCPGTSGYVSNPDDCNDSNATIYTGYSICADINTVRRCISGGTWSNSACTDKCYNGNCRAGTIGVAGSVSCWASAGTAATCSTSVGCTNGSCGTVASPGRFRCDGPTDCPGQTCCYGSDMGGPYSSCVDSCSTFIVCDPLASSSPCISGYHCPSDGTQLVWCVPN